MANTMTGQIYYGEDAINAAIGRGEPITEISEQVARFLEIGKSVDGVTLADLQSRIEAIEAEGSTERKMKAMGLVMP